MPFRSKAQSRLMEGIAHGSIPAGRGRPSKAVADEFVQAGHGQHVHDLPDHVAKTRKAEGGAIGRGYPPKFTW